MDFDDAPCLLDEELRPVSTTDRFKKLTKHKPVAGYDAQSRKPLIIRVHRTSDEFGRIDERMKCAFRLHLTMLYYDFEYADNLEQQIPVFLAHAHTYWHGSK